MNEAYIVLKLVNYKKGSMLISRAEQGLVRSKAASTLGCITPILPIALPRSSISPQRPGKYAGSAIKIYFYLKKIQYSHLISASVLNIWLGLYKEIQDFNEKSGS